MEFEKIMEAMERLVKNPVLPPTDVVGPPTDVVGPHGASSKEKAILAIHPRSSERARSSERGILAFSREEREHEKRLKALGSATHIS